MSKVQSIAVQPLNDAAAAAARAASEKKAGCAINWTLNPPTCLPAAGAPQGKTP